MEKVKSGVMIFVGICILLAGISISGGLGNVADSINQIDAESDQSYELVVRDGFIYISDTVNGQVWKKADVPEGKWEEIDHFFND